MDHVAILRKARISKGDNLLKDILEGKKTIESRWYVNKISPWDKIQNGDTVYFKESGCPATAKARVSKVLQYENLDEGMVKEIIDVYGNQIAPHTSKDDFYHWAKKEEGKRYCILVFLEDVKEISPFNISKTGFGIFSAWLTVGNIDKVRI